MMRRTAWIWLVGAIVWLVDGLVSAYYRSAAHAKLNLLLSLLFLIAWLFYRKQPR